MRFVPLIPSSSDPAPWLPLGPLALRWGGACHAAWPGALRRGAVVHAVHLPEGTPWASALEALRLGLGMDFLVLPAARPATREAGFRLLGDLEALLEATAGRGVKLALRLEPGAEAAVVELLRSARGEAVGFCWHPGLQDAETLADRLWCAEGAPGVDLAPLQRLGYRWDVDLEARTPGEYRQWAADLAAGHPPVLFPAEMPATVLGRPVMPDDSLVFGKHWERP